MLHRIIIARGAPAKLSDGTRASLYCGELAPVLLACCDNKTMFNRPTGTTTRKTISRFLRCPQMSNSMEWGAGLAAAHRASNAFAFGDSVDTIDERQLDFLQCAAGPVNLHLIDLVPVAQTKVDAHVI